MKRNERGPRCAINISRRFVIRLTIDTTFLVSLTHMASTFTSGPLVMKERPGDADLGKALHDAWVFFDGSGRKVKVTTYAQYLAVAVKKGLLKKKGREEKEKDKSKDKKKEKEKEKDGHEQVAPFALAFLREYEPGIVAGEQALGPGLTLLTPIGPIILRTPDAALRAKALSEWRALIGASSRELREGTFQYASGLTYTGTWRDGLPHGQGVLEGASVRCEGTWHADLKAGYGQVMSKSGVEWHKVRTGWRVTLPEAQGVVMLPVEAEGKQHESGLLDPDFTLLMSKGALRTYAAGEVVLHEGAVNRSLFLVKSGTLAVHKVDPATKRPRLIATLTGNRLFGELSVLDKAVASATVTAETPVELVEMALPQLLALFGTNPGISRRFMRRVAASLADRVRHAKQPGGTPKVPAAERWAAVKKAIAFTAALRQSIGPAEMEGSAEDDQTVTLSEESSDPAEVAAAPVLRVLRALAAGHLDDALTPLTADVHFLDPYAPKGIAGTEEVRKHLGRLVETGHLAHSRWEVLEHFPHQADSRCTLRLLLTLPSRPNPVPALVLLVMKQDKVAELEMFYDTAAVGAASGQPGNLAVSDERKTLLHRDGDAAFRTRFTLRDLNAKVLHEFECSITLPGMEPQLGHVYISQNVICFGARLFGLDVRTVLPWSCVKTIELDGASKIVLRAQEVPEKKALDGAALKDIRYDLAFDDTAQADGALAQLQSFLKAKVASASPELGNESFFDAHLRTHVLHTKIADQRLVPCKSDKGIRLEGPKADSTMLSFRTEVAAGAMSNYPRVSGMEGGKVVLNDKVRQGDPVCDQFVVERMANAVVFALADGCNWGSKPRRAAYVASHSFVDNVASNLSGLLTTQAASQTFLQAFGQAHAKIVEGNEKNWWEVGTTTMVGGALLENGDPETPWSFVAAGVGDCKGSRSGSNITDAQDPGGRLGPHNKGHPDLRNLTCWAKSLHEDDIVIICSDGIHDNLDPQNFGKLPKDFQLADTTWEAADPVKVEGIKQDFAASQLVKLLSDVVGSKLQSWNNVPATALAEKLLAHAHEVTASSRKFMEEHPDKPLPHNYAQFPGKLDHASCVVLRARRVDLGDVDRKLDSYVSRMRHPITGLDVRSTSGDSFSGKSLIDWLRTTDLSTEQAEEIAQWLLNFRHIRNTNPSKRGQRETFSVDRSYEIQVYNQNMTPSDWALLMKVGQRKKYSKGSVIVAEGEKTSSLFQITRGQCSVQKDGKTLAVLGETELLGEIGFLEGHPASATVVADSDRVDVYSLEDSQLKIAWVADPALEGRFYHYLASILARRLKLREEGDTK